MARKEARIQAGIWNNADFKALPAAAQRLYFLLLSQPDLSYCGVLAYRPRRWALMACDTTAKTIEAAMRFLMRDRFVVVDEPTEEAWVRTFIEHNKVMASPNLVRAMAHDFTAIQSEPIREGLLEGFGEGLAQRLADGFKEPLPEAFVKAVEERFPYVRIVRSTHNPHLTTHNPQPTSADAEFDAFWTAYPRKTSKPPAETAWFKAARKADPEDIIAAAERYRDDPNRVDEFTAYPATWLNQERWNDPPLPARDGSRRATNGADKLAAALAYGKDNPL